jgi:hypothetical protein
MNWIAVLGLVVGLMPGMALATVDIDVTFEAGALPSNFGMGSIAVGDTVDQTPPGVWHANYSSGTAGFWRDNNASFVTPDGTVIHGEIDLEVFAWGNPLAHTLINHGRAGQYFFEFLAGDGSIRVNGNSVAVANNTGRHTYGWSLDFTGAPVVNLFFDNAPVGDAAGYAAPASHNSLYFGRAAGGATNQDFHRFTIQEGALPEPGTLSLLAAGAALLISRRRRA